LRCAGVDRVSDMEIRILGPLEVSAAGRLVVVPGDKARLLLAALVVHANEVVSIDRLMEFLWHGSPPETAGNTLQTYISHLRRSLEPSRAPREPSGLLITRAPGYRLVLDPDQVDALRFEKLVEQARKILGDDPREAAALLRSGLSLWRGEPLADFTFEPFAQPEITRLTELRLAALEERIDADLALGAHAAVCGELARLVRENPRRERLSGQLMIALYRCGRQADALRAYTDLRRTLVDQLGIDPSPEVTRIEQAILQQRPDLDWPRTVHEVTPEQSPVKDGRVPDGSVQDSLALARSAIQQCQWQQAFDLFRFADQQEGLSGEDLDALAEAAFWLGRPHQAHVARQRAHAALLAEGQAGRAAMVAIVLSANYGARRRFSVAEGWFQRAQRLLTDEPEGPEHGFLAWARAMLDVGAGDLNAAVEAARRAFDIGRRLAVPDLQALGLVHQGYVLVRQGKVTAGLRLLDEAMTWAVDAHLAPTSSAVVFCRTIDTCYELGDYRRAAEWMEAITDCFARTGIQAFPGDCEAHSIAMLVGRGAWSEGEQRARQAVATVEPMDLTHVGLTLAQIGEIRLHQGDLAGAEEALAQAARFGSTEQPGMALVRLARGDLHGAATGIGVALADQTQDLLSRGRLLPAQVEIALANGDIASAQSAAAELTEISKTYPGKAIAAAAECARGAVTLALGDSPAAAGLLRRGVALWQEAGAPHPAAKARLRLGEALDQAGDRAHALVEIEAACAMFEALGARLDFQHAKTMLRGLADYQGRAPAPGRRTRARPGMVRAAVPPQRRGSR
jgi:DNA-binding SARP family transcriptional activator